MKRAYRRMLNIFSFALLLFALYLNFVKKEPADNSEINVAASTTTLSDLNPLKTSSEKPPGGPIVLK